MEIEQENSIKNILNLIIPKNVLDAQDPQPIMNKIPKFVPTKPQQSSNIQEKRQIQLPPLIIQPIYDQASQKLYQNSIYAKQLQQQQQDKVFQNKQIQALLDSQYDISSALSYGNSASTQKPGLFSKENLSLFNQIDSSTKLIPNGILPRKHSSSGDTFEYDLNFQAQESNGQDNHLDFLQNLLKLDSSSSLDYQSDSAEQQMATSNSNQESTQTLDSPTFHKQLLQTLLKNYYQEKKHQQIKEQQQQQQILQLYQLYQNSKQKNKQQQQQQAQKQKIQNLSLQQQQPTQNINNQASSQQNLPQIPIVQNKSRNENLSINSIEKSEEQLQKNIVQEQFQNIKKEDDSQNQQLNITTQLPNVQNDINVKEENAHPQEQIRETSLNKTITMETSLIAQMHDDDKVKENINQNQQQNQQLKQQQDQEVFNIQQSLQQYQTQNIIIPTLQKQVQPLYQTKQQVVEQQKLVVNSKIDNAATSIITAVSPPQPKIEKKFICNCRKTKCLKLYCECFGHGEACGPQCNCVGCSNDSRQQIQSDVSNQILNAAVGLDTLQTQQSPNPYSNSSSSPLKQSQQQLNVLPQLQQQSQQSTNSTGGVVKKKFKGCNCRKSNCLKKYCECYMNGFECSKKCKCCDCHNNKLAKIQKQNKQLNMNIHDDALHNQQYLNQYKLKEEQLQNILSTVKAQQQNNVNPLQYLTNSQQIQNIHLLNAQKKVQYYQQQQQQQQQHLLDNILLKKKLKEENQALLNAMKVGKQYFDGLERAAIIENQFKQYITDQDKQNMQINFY